MLGNAAPQLNAIPPPASPYELAAAPIVTLTTPADRAAALALLDRARTAFTLLSNSTPPFQWNVTFNAGGFPVSNGLGQMEETWLGGGDWRWTADINGQTTDRYGFHGVYSSSPRTPVPMPMQLLREAMLWPVQYATNARLSLRSANSAWQGHAVTCILVGPPRAPEPPLNRGWMESEYCIAPGSGLLQIASDAPGLYYVYDYSASASFHGHVLPRAVNVIAGGQTVMAIQLTNLSDAIGADPASVHPPVRSSRSAARFSSIRRRAC